MTLRLVDRGWDEELRTALRADPSHLRIVCPFIKQQALAGLFDAISPDRIEVITRFDLADFFAGVSDIEALRLLLERGAMIRGVRGLHAKVYLFGSSRAIVTSANLTRAALRQNHEFGVIISDPKDVTECGRYFDSLWARSGPDLSSDALSGMQAELDALLTSYRPGPGGPSFPDRGVRVDPAVSVATSSGWAADATQAFVKFFGEGDNRSLRAFPVLSELVRSGGHWAVAYPKGKRPRSLQDGAIIFFGRLSKDPNDTLIFGRAIGLRHVDGRDDVSPDELIARPWKRHWPHYVRVHHGEFVSGTIDNGISLNALMEALGARAFRSTSENLEAGAGNTNPRRAYSQQAAVELSREGLAWLNSGLEAAFQRHGVLTPSDLRALDWPLVPQPNEVP